MVEFEILNNIIEDFEKGCYCILYEGKPSTNQDKFLYLLKELKTLFIEKVEADVLSFEKEQK